MLLSHKQKQTTNTHKSVDESHAYHSQWKKAAQKATDSTTHLLWYVLKSKTTQWFGSVVARDCACMLHISHFSRVWLFATSWTVACQAPLSMGFFRQEYWSGLPCPPPGDLPNLGIEPTSLTSPALAGRFFTSSATWEARDWEWRKRHSELFRVMKMSITWLWFN